MTTPAELLSAIAEKLRAAVAGEENALVFKSVRTELALFDLQALLRQSTHAPFARVCFQKGVPAPRSDGGFDLDVSVAIVVVAGRTGRPNPDISSADMAVLELMLVATKLIVDDPYVGLTQLQAAEFGDQVVASSDEDGSQGFAIALCEMKWRLLDVVIARSPIQEALETGRASWAPPQYALNDGEPEPPLPGGGP